MQYSYKKSEIQIFCRNQVFEKSSSFEKRAIKECYGHIFIIFQRIFQIWVPQYDRKIRQEATSNDPL